LQKARAFSQQNQCVLVIKGAHTLVMANGVGHINSTGNPGMATAGSGDVLTGIITGLISQDYEPLEAAIFGVYMHGLAGDIAASNEGYEAITASKLIDNLGSAIVELFQRDNVEGQQQGNAN
jgi:NAD(P)H-hydrate repair Nnr-like enzyme with NAD(P)H-hydrate dehydratase domain